MEQPRASDRVQCGICPDPCLPDVNPGISCPSGHFTCRGCLQRWVLAEAEEGNIARSNGTVRCPWRGGIIGPGAVQSCASEAAWRIDNPALCSVLDDDTIAAIAATLLRTISIATEREARHELQKAIVSPPLMAGTTAERIAARKTAILTAHPPGPGEGGCLHCPRCHFPFVDFSGCAALKCVNDNGSGCNAQFCALCLSVFSLNVTAHAHFFSPLSQHKGIGPGYMITEEQFRVFHVRRRRDSMRAAIAALSEETDDVRRGLLEALHLHNDESPRDGVIGRGTNAVSSFARGFFKAIGDFVAPTPGTGIDPKDSVAILREMKRRSGVAGVADWGFSALRSASLSVARKGLLEANAPSILIYALRKHGGVASVAEAGCRVLCNVSCVSDALKQAMLTEGGAAAIATCMQTHVDNPSVAAMGCRALGVLALASESDEVSTSDPHWRRQAVIDAGGVRVVKNALGQHSANERVVEWGGYALGILTPTPAVRRRRCRDCLHLLC